MGFEPKRDEVRRMIAESDRDGSGTISFDTFQSVMANKMHARDPKEEAIKAFRLFDDDETGTTSLKNLRRVAKELGENMTDDELQEVIDFCDKVSAARALSRAAAAHTHALHTFSHLLSFVCMRMAHTLRRTAAARSCSRTFARCSSPRRRSSSWRRTRRAPCRFLERRERV